MGIFYQWCQKAPSRHGLGDGPVPEPSVPGADRQTMVRYLRGLEGYNVECPMVYIPQGIRGRDMGRGGAVFASLERRLLGNSLAQQSLRWTSRGYWTSEVPHFRAISPIILLLPLSGTRSHWIYLNLLGDTRKPCLFLPVHSWVSLSMLLMDGYGGASDWVLSKTQL